LVKLSFQKKGLFWISYFGHLDLFSISNLGLSIYKPKGY